MIEFGTVELGALISEYSKRNKSKSCTDVYSVTNSNGFMPSVDYFSKEVFSKDISTYKIVQKGMFAYNPSRINVGSIAFLQGIEQVVVSPLYVVFKIDDKKLSHRYLNYFLHSAQGLDQIRNLTSGSVRDSLKYSALSRIQIPLPSLEVQEKYADILDKISQIIDKRKEQIMLMDKVVKDLYFFEFGNPKDNPKQLKKVKIKDIAEICSGSTPNRNNSEYFIGTIPWVKTGEVNFQDIYDAEEHISNTALEETSCRILPVNSILVAMYGQGKTRGQSAILRIPATTNQACAAIQPSEAYITEYLYQTLVVSYNDLREQARGGNQPNLNLGMIKNFEVFLPRLSEQKNFVIKTNNINAQKSKIQSNLSYLEITYKATLQKAFTGELF